MFCENIYHICQHRYNSLNTNNIKADRCTPKRKYLSAHLPYPPPLPEHHSTATGTSFHHNRNIIPLQPEHYSTTTGTSF